MARSPTPLHRRLWVVVAAALLPTAALFVTAVVLQERDQKAEIARATIETMRAMVSAVDGELKNTIVAGETLVASDALDQGDIPRFYEEAKRVASAYPNWITITLSDPAGQQVLNVLEPLDTSLPSLARRLSFQTASKTGKPAIGNLGMEGDRTGFAVRVPVLQRGRVAYVLTIFVSPESIQDVIRRQRVPPDGVVSIFDARGNHVARSRNHAAILGRPPSATLQKLMAEGDEGWGPSTTLEGQSIYAAFSRSAESGWSVAVGIPVQEIDEAVRQSLATVGLGLFMSLVVGALVSLSMARLVTGPIRELRSAAQAVGRGAVPELPPTQVAEVHEVALALVGAARARRKAESELEQTLERERDARTVAEKANRSKDEFLAMLGHELRNPMSAIGNAIAVIEAQPRAAELAPTEAKARRVIRRQVDHLARLVDDLLDVARVVSGKVILELRTVDLAECVRHSIASLSAGGYLDGHSVDVEAEPAWVRADPTRFEQVINNLVVNAVKYTPKGGHISVVTRTENGRALLRVSDDGVGIPAELLPEVFGLFTQGEQALDRAQGGLGIGLTLVQRLVEMHGGEVSATSAGENQGSVFSVDLPAIDPPEGVPVDTPVVRSPRRHVLLVEDNRDAREMLQALLELRGHRGDVAKDGPSGVSRALASPPEVAFVDLGLPGFDGYEVARRLRAELPPDKLLLVALSGYGSLEDRQKSQQAGFDHHLVKPVAKDALENIIGRVGEAAVALRL